ncbi:MAG: hypothetical protein DWQ19_10935 [Crenarchaeota archaeon]|nr:MAG: hypothetical protein DWQ19_10935 [Thermoproteota archaeon]
MDTLNFKSWLENIDAEKAVAADPTLSAAAKGAEMAARTAVEKGQDPVKAAQMAVLDAGVPSNKLGQVLPRATTLNKMKAKMKSKMKKK